MRIKPTVQRYDRYTNEDFKVWELLFQRQQDLLHNKASTHYLDAIQTIGFNAGEIPDFKQTNTRLRALTGWQLTVAPELVPDELFFSLLSRKIFPATCWLRRWDELDYLEEPDMFHDVFGHAPLLTHAGYAAFMEAFGKLAVKWLGNPEAIRFLSRIYWFTIEFGLIMEADKIKIYGAGILSSPGETQHALSKLPKKTVFDVHNMLDIEYRTDSIQEQYFVLSSFDQLYESLSEIEALLEQQLAMT